MGSGFGVYKLCDPRYMHAAVRGCCSSSSSLVKGVLSGGGGPTRDEPVPTQEQVPYAHARETMRWTLSGAVVDLE